MYNTNIWAHWVIWLSEGLVFLKNKIGKNTYLLRENNKKSSANRKTKQELVHVWFEICLLCQTFVLCSISWVGAASNVHIMSLFAQISDYYIGLSRLGSLDHNPCIREKSKLPSNLLKHDDSSVLNYYSKIVNQCPPVFQLLEVGGLHYPYSPYTRNSGVKLWKKR